MHSIKGYGDIFFAGTQETADTDNQRRRYAVHWLDQAVWIAWQPLIRSPRPVFKPEQSPPLSRAAYRSFVADLKAAARSRTLVPGSDHNPVE
jgi:hypothetical protein